MAETNAEGTGLCPAARRHIEGRFTVTTSSVHCHTYHLESYPGEEDPDGEEEYDFYAEREDVRTHALLCLGDFVALVERSLSLIPADAGGAEDYRREAEGLFEFINLAVEDEGVPEPGVTAEGGEVA